MGLTAALVFLLTATDPHLAPAAPRMLSESESEPWKAVGRVNIATASRTGMCTGTLIEPDLVLTAAHCVIDRRRGRTFAPGNVHFVAGWRQGQMAAHRKARAIAVPPDYLDPPSGGDGRLARDVALIRLERPIDPDTVPPFAVGDRAPERDLTLISYRRDRAHALTRQDGCGVIDNRGTTLLLACEAVEGVSGSPVFAGDGPEARVIGVISAMGRIEGRDVVLATEVGDVLAELLAAVP